MPTIREMVLREKYKEMLDKPMISIDNIDDLMDAVDKVLQNYRQTLESRDRWKAKAEDLKNKLLEFKDVK